MKLVAKAPTDEGPADFLGWFERCVLVLVLVCRRCLDESIDDEDVLSCLGIRSYYYCVGCSWE